MGRIIALRRYNQVDQFRSLLWRALHEMPEKDFAEALIEMPASLGYHPLDADTRAGEVGVWLVQLPDGEAARLWDWACQRYGWMQGAEEVSA